MIDTINDGIESPRNILSFVEIVPPVSEKGLRVCFFFIIFIFYFYFLFHVCIRRPS